ncbi:tetratricopeptide repeat protein [Solibacillus sp. NPDC093137]|uniref:tetratricopeptide repeat protein n=1 Tax=Solibacillus sp. NPDC093137 TaxID=3390678 RepID=UPI003D00588E
MMEIKKTSMISTSIIANTVKSLDKVNFLTTVEENFLDPKNLKITSGMSITDSQNINHQLRYFDLHRALRLINFISYKVYQELQSNNIQEITFKFNISQVSEPELFFIDRLKHYSQNIIDIIVAPEVNKITDEVDFEDMPFYLSVGDLWTSLKIGNDILNSKGTILDSQFILNFAITQNNLGNTMAGEALLNQILSKEVNNSNENEIKITALYILSMLYLRHHDRKFHSIEKAENYLEQAFNLLNDPSFIHNDKEFKRIFNRNGYALLLFKKNQIEEAINLLEIKIRELDVLISGGKEYAVLHKTVLLYNISQCYNVLGDFRKSVELLQQIIEIDTYDADYHYEIVKILFDHELLDEGFEWLEIIEKKNIVDLSIQSAMKGYYFLQKEDYQNAALHYETAYNLEYNDRYTGEILYSYLYTLFNLEQYETILNIDISGINLNDDYKADIEYLINETNEMRFKNNCEGLKI